jgi:hypothetical protein
MRDLGVSTEEECGSPAKRNCASPMLKKSVALQKLVKENRSIAGEHAGASESLVAAHEDGSSKEEKTEKETARKEGAVDIQEQTRDMEKETELIARRADFYDASELFLDISIVLCSIAILTLAKSYWRFSFITTAIGIGAAAWGWFLR